MMICTELLMILLASWCKDTEAQVTLLEAFIPQHQALKDVLANVLNPPSQNMRNLRLAKQLGKVQSTVDDSIPFPCSLKNSRSKERPSSVHALRPGDIDVIAAMGDSLSAGNGLVATAVFDIIVQNRGLSFSGGGDGTWKQYVTLPNIIKEFNPNLIGYSLSNSYIHHNLSHFNVAEASAMSSDMPFMARELIRRIKNSPKVNINRHWKMVTLMIGDNDFCSDMCYRRNPESVLKSHRLHLTRALRILRDNLPRTMVNIILTPHLKALRGVTRINRPPICYITHNVECPCMFGLQFQNQQNKFDEIMSKWQDLEVEITYQAEFDRDDFTVVTQPFTLNYILPRTAEGYTDYSALSQDCFHLSQKEDARAALSLWNNLLEPEGRKTTNPSELFNFKCPTSNQPYLFTRRNSVR